MITTRTLTRLNGSTFYRDAEDKTSVCQEFVEKYLHTYADTISLSVSNKRPHSKGWFKVEAKRHGCIFLNGERTTALIHDRLTRFLRDVCNVAANSFYEDSLFNCDPFWFRVNW